MNVLSALIIAAALMSAPPSHAQNSTTVSTSSGTVIGKTDEGVQSWLGIPYATPPVGALRWQPPQPVRPWETPLQADTPASSCAQNADLGVFAQAGGSEDCLYLDVHRAANGARPAQPLPVFVWIHGGALQVGQGDHYNPRKLATRGEALVITLNYRLGVLGFLSHPALDGEGHDFANYGLMDQQAALQWIKQNAAAFGGDPNNITIAGESSGGNSVMAHVASPGSAGLFDHVIAMSGGGIMARHPAFGAPRPLEVARQAGSDFGKAVGCETGGSECLRRLSTQAVLDAQKPYMLNEFVIDGTVLPMHPADAYRTGRINKATLVNGSTRDEGTFFVALPEIESGDPMTDSDYWPSLEEQYGPELAAQVLREYRLESFNSPSEAYAASLTDSMFACTGRALSRALADKVPVYAYEFSDDTAPSYIAPTSFPLGAAHTYEVSYLFPVFVGGGDATVSLSPAQQRLSDQMVDYFSDVARLGAGGTDWTRYDLVRDNYLTFAPSGAGMTSGPDFSSAHHCAFWDQTGTY